MPLLKYLTIMLNNEQRGSKEMKESREKATTTTYIGTHEKFVAIPQ